MGGAIVIAIAINNLLNTIVMNTQINGVLFIKGLPLVIQWQQKQGFDVAVKGRLWLNLGPTKRNYEIHCKHGPQKKISSVLNIWSLPCHHISLPQSFQASKLSKLCI